MFRWLTLYEVLSSSRPLEGRLRFVHIVHCLGNRVGTLLSDYDVYGRCPLGPARLGGLLPSGVGRG